MPCMRRLISPISSRKMVPSSAFSSMPGLSRYAPVKEPFTWPNNSDSSSVSGRPAQLTVMNGRSERSLCAWTLIATSSLPTPLSPVMRIFASDSATRWISCCIATMAGLRPTSCA